MAAKIDAELIKAGETCELSSDPSKYLQKFNDWLEHHSLVTDAVGIADTKKVELLLLWGGKRLREIRKEAGVVTETEATADTPADSFQDAIKKIKVELERHVNLSMAMFELMHAQQGTKSFTEFQRQIDRLAAECQFATKPYDKKRAMRDALIYGTSDEKLTKTPSQKI